MKTTTYRIYMHNDNGSQHIDALAASVDGLWHNTADVGELSVGFITLPAENAYQGVAVWWVKSTSQWRSLSSGCTHCFTIGGWAGWTGF